MAIISRVFAGVKKALRIFGVTVFAVLLALVVYIMVCGCTGRAASVFGTTVIKIISGSMEPSIHEGDYISVKAISTDELKVGDIISFYSDDKDIEGRINTHRIVKKNANNTFVTKGDANKSEDSVLVSGDKVIGIYTGKLRFFRWLNSFASVKKLLMLLVIIPTLLAAIYEVKTIAAIKVDGKMAEAQKQAEQEKEKLMREAIDKEIERLRKEDEDKEKDKEESGGEQS